MSHEHPFETHDSSPARRGYDPLGPPVEGEPFTPTMLAHLRQTRPWVRALSILGFALAGLFAAIGAATVALGAEMAQEMGLSAWTGALYIAVAVLWVFPSLYLHRYASAIGRLLDGGDAQIFEEALQYQKSFWKIVGMMALVLLGIWFLTAVGALLAALLGTNLAVVRGASPLQQ